MIQRARSLSKSTERVFFSHDSLQSVQEALARLEHGSLQATASMYSDLLRWCGCAGTLSDLKRIHDRVVRDGLFPGDASLGRHIVQLYIRFGSLSDAHATFNDILKSGSGSHKGVVLWTALISGYVKQGQFSQAIQLFEDMQRNHVIPDKVTYITLLNAFQDLERAKVIHTRISEAGYDTDLTVANALLSMYVNCSSLEDAERVFRGMTQRDVVSWTAMISAHAKYGDFDRAMTLFRLMQLQGATPNKVTLLSLLSSCDDLSLALLLHKRAFDTGYQSDVPVCNAVLNMYAKCGELELARSLFDRMPVRNTVSWTAMIAACIRKGDSDTALKLFRDMQDEVVEPDWITYVTVLNACMSAATTRWIHGCIIRSGHEPDTAVGNAIIKTYTRCGSLKEACRTFSGMKQKDRVSWTAMISAYADFGRLNRALHSFKQMQLNGFHPNEVTLITLVNACASASSLKEGMLVHRLVSEKGLESDPVVATALLNMYGKCGNLETASDIFRRLERPDVVSWTSMIASYAQNGDGNTAAKLFSSMQVDGVKPVDVTFVSIVSACSHAGLVHHGCEFFSSMIHEHRIELQPELCGCVVDLFGRAGKLEEAEYFIDRMPFKPTPAVWMAFLAACKTHGDIRRGQRAAAQILGLDAKTTAAVIALSESYSATGKAADGETLRRLIAEGCLDKHIIDDSASVT